MSESASNTNLAADSPRPARKNKRFYLWGIPAFCLLVISVLFGTPFSPFHHGRFLSDKESINAWMIARALNNYAKDNGAYPNGNSSTEIFQKLLDEKYVSDPSVFYLPFPGKTKGVPGQPIKPENVSWDVTGGAGLDDSDALPVVFVTGCKVNYVPDASAIVLKKPLPGYRDEHLTWLQSWNNDVLLSFSGLLTVVYKAQGCVGFKLQPDGTALHFIPANFNAHGKTYRQLTPEGPMP